MSSCVSSCCLPGPKDQKETCFNGVHVQNGAVAMASISLFLSCLGILVSFVNHVKGFTLAVDLVWCTFGIVSVLFLYFGIADKLPTLLIFYTAYLYVTVVCLVLTLIGAIILLSMPSGIKSVFGGSKVSPTTTALIILTTIGVMLYGAMCVYAIFVVRRCRVFLSGGKSSSSSSIQVF